MPEDNSDNQNWPKKPKISRKKIIKHFKKAETATIRHTHKFIVKRWDNVREVQSKVVFWIILMGLLIAATGFQMMWFQKSYLTTTRAEDSTYVEAVLGPLDTLNPLYASSSAEKSVEYLVFSSLLKYDKTGHLNNDIASKIEIDDSGKIYTVSIRQDVKWHDGAELTTDDISFTLGLIKDQNSNSVISGWNNISVKVIDKQKIQFTLPSVYAAFKHALTFAILPKHILGQVSPSQIRENSFSQNPIGSGPFRVRFIQNSDENSNQKVLYLLRNDQYYNGKAKLAKMQLNVYQSNEKIVEALNSAQVNAAADLNMLDINKIDTDKYTSISKPIQSGVYALINTKSKLLNNLSLRKALAMATDKASLIKSLPEGTVLLDLPFTDGQISGDLPKAIGFNLESSKKLLNDEGWILNKDGVREKDGKKLEISVVALKGSEFEKVLEIVAKQWRDVGFVVESKIVDLSDISQNVVKDILQPRKFDVLIYRLDIGADPDVYAYWHSTQATQNGYNYSNYSNIISDDALTTARAKIETEIRNAKYITFLKQWVNDVPAIGLYQSTVQYVFSNNVYSFDKDIKFVSSLDRYSDVLNWSVGDQTVYKTP